MSLWMAITVLLMRRTRILYTCLKSDQKIIFYEMSKIFLSQIFFFQFRLQGNIDEFGAVNSSTNKSVLVKWTVSDSWLETTAVKICILKCEVCVRERNSEDKTSPFVLVWLETNQKTSTIYNKLRQNTERLRWWGFVNCHLWPLLLTTLVDNNPREPLKFRYCCIQWTLLHWPIALKLASKKSTLHGRKFKEMSKTTQERKRVRINVFGALVSGRRAWFLYYLMLLMETCPVIDAADLFFF